MKPALAIVRTNTILYCDRWAETVAFYRDRLGLTVTHETDWFVEVAVSGIANRWNADYVEFHDPEGTRIELWSPTPVG